MLYTGGVLRPVTSEIRKATRKTTNSTWAIQAEVPAMPANPKNPAIIATIKNINAHERNMVILLSFCAPKQTL